MRRPKHSEVLWLTVAVGDAVGGVMHVLLEGIQVQRGSLLLHASLLSPASAMSLIDAQSAKVGASLG